jgi:hypothetical protein
MLKRKEIQMNELKALNSDRTPKKSYHTQTSLDDDACFNCALTGYELNHLKIIFYTSQTLYTTYFLFFYLTAHILIYLNQNLIHFIMKFAIFKGRKFTIQKAVCKFVNKTMINIETKKTSSCKNLLVNYLILCH